MTISREQMERITRHLDGNRQEAAGAWILDKNALNLALERVKELESLVDMTARAGSVEAAREFDRAETAEARVKELESGLNLSEMTTSRNQYREESESLRIRVKELEAMLSSDTAVEIARLRTRVKELEKKLSDFAAFDDTRLETARATLPGFVWRGVSPKDAAAQAVEYADELIAALEKKS